MNSIWQVFVSSLKGGADSEVSSRRLITMIFMQVSVIVNFAIIVLAFVVAMRPPSLNASPIQALDRVLELTIIINVTILLLIGLITWQNVNDTIGLVRNGTSPEIAKAADNIQEQAQGIKEAVGAIPSPGSGNGSPKSTTA